MADFSRRDLEENHHGSDRPGSCTDTDVEGSLTQRRPSGDHESGNNLIPCPTGQHRYDVRAGLLSGHEQQK